MTTPPSDADAPAADGLGEHSLRPRRQWKPLLLVVAIAVALVIVHATPLKDLLRDVGKLRETLKGVGIWLPPLVVVGGAGVMLIGAPRLGISFLCGVLFGFWWGFPLAMLATLLGAYGTFLFSRWSGREWVAQRLGRHRRLGRFLRHADIPTVFLARQMPMPGFLLNLAFGVTGIGHGTFLLGSFLGFLPQGMIAVLLGSGLGQSSPLLAGIQLATAATVLVISVAIVWRLWRRRRRPDTEGA